MPEDWVLRTGGITMGDLGKDLRYGLRTLARTPVFTGIVVLILAIGIGANTAIFSVLKTAFLQPLPFPEPNELAVLWNRGEDGGRGPASGPDYLDWRSRNGTFEEMGAFGGRSFNLTEGNEPERLPGLMVTSSLLRLLDVQPLVGRSIVADDEKSGNTEVVLLSHALWTRRFGADADLLGRSIRVDGRPLTVIGIMPPDFQVPSPWWHYGPPQQLWVPFPVEDQLRSRGSHSYPVIGRLHDGVDIGAAQEDMRAVSAGLAEEYPDTNAGNAAWIVPLHMAMYGDVGFQVLLVFGAAGLVLFIACGNVAGLQLTRSTGRRTEIAVRAAMGAGRGRVVRQLLTESTVLAVAGGAAGVLMAAGSLGVFRSLIPPTIPRADEIAVDGPVLLFTLAVALLSGVFFGLAPALSASRANLSDALKEGAVRGRWGGPRRDKLRTAFVTIQFALCLMLLNGGFLLVRSYTLLRGSSLGFDAENVLTMAVSLGDRFDNNLEQASFVEDVMASLRSIPEVTAVGASTKLPLRGGTNASGRAEHEEPRVRPGDGWLIELSAVLGDYHEAMGIPLLAGRRLTPADTMPGEPNVLINETMAQRLWPDEDPLGKRFTLQEDPPRWITVVGVVGDVRQWGLESRARPEIYLPYVYRARPQIFLTLQSETDPETLLTAARARILSVDPEQPVSDIRTTRQILQGSLERREFFTLMTGFFAVIALILASVGIYGVTSFQVQQRTHEIGVRIAMGAARRRVLGLVLTQGVRLATYGLLLGVTGALVAGALMASFLWGVSPRDPLSLALTGLVLAAVAVVGSLVPAVRATRVSPVKALRAE
jgi:putative ABC transport system permease protein